MDAEIVDLLRNGEIVAVLDDGATLQYQETKNGDHVPIISGNYHFELRKKVKEK